jgi:hypothetical protein
MNLIIVPSSVNYNEYSLRYKIRYILSYFKIVRPPKFNLNGEFNHYGEITRILSPDSVVVPVKLKSIYFDDNILKYKNNALIENYPSNFNFIEPKVRSYSFLKKRIQNFDAVLISLQADQKYFSLVESARKHGVKVVFFDKKDHNRLYFDPKEDIYRGFGIYRPDLFFKQDIPLGNSEPEIVPTCPIPCSHVQKLPFKSDKKYSLSFVGDFKPGVTLPDRKLILEFLKEHFNQTYIRYSSDGSHFHSFEDMNRIYNDSKILVSPSGIVWDSYRHADFIRYNSPILLPRPNTKTAPGDFVDMENCIMYDVEYLSINKARLLNTEELIVKLNYVLDNEDVQIRIRNSYFELISKFHTRQKRSEYILSSIKSII